MKKVVKFFKPEYFYRGTLFLIFAVSFCIQTFLLLKNPSFWHDEAALALNITGKSFTGLLGGLDNMQAAPPAFLLISKLMLIIFNPKTDYWRDFCLKIIPYAAGVFSIAGFYYFSRIFFKQKRQQLFANFLFALNPCAILYSAQYKQYTCELFAAIILLIIFYKIINGGKIKNFYYFVIFLAPFFSLSSAFIIFSGCLAMLFAKNVKKPDTAKVALSFLAGLTFLYLINLKNVYAHNYSGMNDFYINLQAFVSFNKPVRTIIRFSELFVTYKFKILNVFAGSVLFLIFADYLFLSKADKAYRILLCMPVFAVIAASALHEYPIQARLILFLLPCFSIITVSAGNKILKLSFVLIYIYSFFTYTYCADWMTYSYARGIAEYLNKNIQPNDIIVLDKGGYEYKYYLQNKNVLNNYLVVPEYCYSDTNICMDFVKNLPENNNYYFLTTGYGADNIARNAGVKYFIPGHSAREIKAVFIKK